MVVGVNGGFGAQFPASNLDGTVGDDFVGVHVRLCPASCLPHAKGKVVVEMPFQHFLGCSDDEVAHFRVELFEGHVGFGGGLFEHAECPNHAGWHGVVPDVKIEQRTGGLAAIISVAGHFQLAHRIGFLSDASFWRRSGRGVHRNGHIRR